MAVTIKFLPETAASYNDTALSALDFGTIVRPGSASVRFKLANAGSTLAEQVVVKAAIGTTGSPDDSYTWKSYSADGTNFYQQISHPNLPAVSVGSTVITAKSVVPADAQLGNRVSWTRVEYIYS